MSQWCAMSGGYGCLGLLLICVGHVWDSENRFELVWIGVDGCGSVLAAVGRCNFLNTDKDFK